MPDKTDTPIVAVATPTNGETVHTQTSEPTANSQVTDGTSNDNSNNVAEIAKWRAQAETAERDRQKAEMRASQLENERRDAERERLEKDQQWEQLAKDRQVELDRITAEREADKNLQDADRFRKETLAGYPEQVQKAANALIEKDPANLSWKNASNWEEAKAQLTDQLDTLSSFLGVATTTDQSDTSTGTSPEINANNPATPTGMMKDPRDMTVAELRAILPKSTNLGY